MAKFSVAYVKQHPVMFGAIFLVFGVLVYIMLNRGASAATNGGTTVVNPGASPDEVAANVQLQTAQLGANSQIAMGQLSLAANSNNNQTQEDLAAMALQAQMAQIQSDHDLGTAQIEASVAALGAQLASNLAITHDNNSFMLDYAKNAQDAATAQLLIGANLQQQLGAQQLAAYKFGAEIDLAHSLKNKNQALSNILIADSGGNITQGDLVQPPSGGGGGVFSAIGSVIGGAVGGVAGAVVGGVA